MESMNHGLVWATTFTLLGAVLGIALLLGVTSVLSRFIDRLTPNIDEEKEMIRGNVAVAQYFGRVVAASILGVSLIIAASIIAGVHG